MTAWQGKRQLTVITACMRMSGEPTFARTEVEVTHEEYENGLHYDLAAERLLDAGLEEPFVHYDSFEAPAFLVAALSESLADGFQAPDLIIEEPVEEP